MTRARAQFRRGYGQVGSPRRAPEQCLGTAGHEQVLVGCRQERASAGEALRHRRAFQLAQPFCVTVC